MSAPARDILQVSTADVLGGAERIARTLFQEYRARGHRSYLAVGRKRTTDAGVLLMTHGEGAGPWRRFWWGLHARLQPNFPRIPAARTMARFFQSMAEPAGVLDRWRGVEDFHFPAAWRLPGLAPRRPQIVHLHNLHGNYFDLRALPALCRAAPLVLTLHDAWLLAGHCAHSMGCARWRSGCGNCPDLGIYPAVRRDATAHNLRRKAEIYRQCRLFAATPCRWLMERVEESALAPALAGSRVIPNGIDLSVFMPGDRAEARGALGLPQDADVLLFAAYGVMRNSFKDFATLRGTAEALSARRAGAGRDRAEKGRPLLVLVLGENGKEVTLPGAEIRFAGRVDDPAEVARYHRAADLYVHAARADTFPTSVLEALACGTPVVATAVGGIGEQVVGIDARGISSAAPTGWLVGEGDSEAMAHAVSRLLGDRRLRMSLAESAARDARNRFDHRLMARRYLEWYEEILGGESATFGVGARPSAFVHS